MNAIKSISKNFSMIVFFTLSAFSAFVFLDMMLLDRTFIDAVLRSAIGMIPVFIGVLFNVMVIQPWREKRKTNCGE